MTTKTRKATKPNDSDAGTESVPDVYDQMAADREGAETQPPSGGETAGEGAKARVTLPDPRELEMIRLGPDNSSPSMRLYRSNRSQLMAMHFDEKPAEQYTQQLREAGWRWRQDDKVWAKKFDRDRRWATQADAEKLFRDIGNAIRADLGLEPTLAVGR
jgi:hypothetical protein